MPPIHAQVLLYEGFDPLDVIAPFEVLHAGGRAAGGALTVSLVAADAAGPVTSGVGGLTLVADAVFDPDLPGVVVVPGAAGPTLGDPDEVDTVPVLLARAGGAIGERMERALANPDLLVSTVCGGSLVLAMAGLLEGRTAVTHHQGMPVLEAAGVTVVEARVVDDGDLVTAGGVTSGLDLGLYLLERLLGPRVALEVEQLFEHQRRGVVRRAVGAEAVPV